ncbi:MAG: lytic transglycosylase domain-containing protein, partial [Maritimibacter sp.]
MFALTRRALITGAVSSIALVGCGGGSRQTSNDNLPLYPNETPELRRLINKWADYYEVPR